MDKKLELLREKYFSITGRLNAPQKSLYFFDTPQGGGCPHVEYNNGLFSLVIVERDVETRRNSTQDLGEILYWLVSLTTGEMASDYEMKHRNNKEDERRSRFLKHVELLGIVDSKWAEMKRAEYNQILIKYPFRDNNQPHFL